MDCLIVCWYIQFDTIWVQLGALNLYWRFNYINLIGFTDSIHEISNPNSKLNVKWRLKANIKPTSTPMLNQYENQILIHMESYDINRWNHDSIHAKCGLITKRTSAWNRNDFLMQHHTTTCKSNRENWMDFILVQIIKIQILIYKWRILYNLFVFNLRNPMYTWDSLAHYVRFSLFW